MFTRGTIWILTNGHVFLSGTPAPVWDPWPLAELWSNRPAQPTPTVGAPHENDQEDAPGATWAQEALGRQRNADRRNLLSFWGSPCSPHDGWREGSAEVD